MCVRAQAIAGVLAGFIAATGCTGARPHPPPTAVMRDDARLQAALESARADFLPAGRLDRLDVTVLLAAPDGAWLRGSVGGQEPWYPASCVKLGFAIAAVHWCASQGRAALRRAPVHGRDGEAELDATRRVPRLLPADAAAQPRPVRRGQEHRDVQAVESPGWKEVRPRRLQGGLQARVVAHHGRRRWVGARAGAAGRGDEPRKHPGNGLRPHAHPRIHCASPATIAR